MTLEDEILFAQVAYKAYGKTTGNKNYQGLEMPTWEALTPTIRSAWLNAIVRVLDWIGLTKIPTEALAPIYYTTELVDAQRVHGMSTSRYSLVNRRVSWSPFHRMLYRYWNNLLIFCLRLKYWIKFGAWF